MRCVLAAAASWSVLAAAALTAGPAIAGSGKLQPGVHVDPGSPAAKQYQIPVAAARNETASAPASPSSGTSPLFGAGVTPPPSRPPVVAQSPARRARRRSHHVPRRSTRPHRRRAVTRRLEQAKLQPTFARIGFGPVGDQAWLALIGGGALVSVLGAAGAVVLKRRP